MRNSRKDQFNRWPRFSEYEVYDGRVRPKPGSRSRLYDPWQEYLNSRKASRIQPPHVELLQLVDSVPLDAEVLEKYQDEDSEDRLLWPAMECDAVSEVVKAAVLDF